MKNKTRTEAAQQPNAKAFAASRGSALRADAENYDDACSLLERHKRTLRLLVAGDFITEEKLEQAWEIAGIGSESREFMAAGIALIQAKLGAALVTLKQEAGGCPATKLLINDALSTASKLLGSQNDADQQQAGGRVS